MGRALAAAPAAPTLVTAISASAFNLGVAGGSQLGRQALTFGLTLTDLPWIGALLAPGAVLLATATATATATAATTTATATATAPQHRTNQQ
ncbi:hypothetical protein [Streptomyces piniterrae]|uniref:hypothetical protein n=1 Tax=Streptomyces piniterrae TaxID=2571125 RepID=UPI00145D383B|nr:hypothetical protein [Streptomyces piniterrae]